MEQVTITTEQVILASNNVLEQVTINEIEAVVVDKDTSVTVVTGLLGPKGDDGNVVSLAQVPDIDTSNLQNGSLLVYSTAASKWKATTTLDNQTLEAGQF
jgi:hypothetical protein